VFFKPIWRLHQIFLYFFVLFPSSKQSWFFLFLSELLVRRNPSFPFDLLPFTLLKSNLNIFAILNNKPFHFFSLFLKSKAFFGFYSYSILLYVCLTIVQANILFLLLSSLVKLIISHPSPDSLTLPCQIVSYDQF